MLEEDRACEKLFGAINYVLDQGGAMMRGGTKVEHPFHIIKGIFG